VRPYETPAAQRAAALFDAEAGHWAGGHAKENIRFAVKRAAGGEEGILEAVVDHFYKPEHRAGVLAYLQRIVRSAQKQERP
jgi:hypothetical protein